MRSDDMRLGYVTGLLAPVLGFVAYGIIYTTAIRPNRDLYWFVTDLFLGTLKYTSSIISLSLIADAFLFFWFARSDRYRSMRGVIAAMLTYGVLIVGIMAYEKFTAWGWI